MSDPARPLEGVRIVETGNGPGAMAARFLCDLGAEVILVEPPGGCPTRHGDHPSNLVDLGFAVENAGKKSVTIDLAAENGMESLLRLLAAADLWVDRRPAAVALGGQLRPGKVRQEMPGLAIASLTPFGLTGPMRDYLASERVLMAAAGILSRSGSPDRPPLLPPGRLAIRSAAVQAAWCMVLALWNQIEHGVGDHLDISVHDCIVQILDPPLGAIGSAAASAETVVQDRSTFEPYPIFRCADGYVRIVILAVRQWQALRSWLGEPEELSDLALERADVRLGRLETIHPPIASFFSARTAQELVTEGQRRGIPIAPVMDLSSVLDAEHFLERGALAELDLARGLRARTPASLLEIDGRRAGIRERAPDPGEHQELLRSTSQRAATRPLVDRSDRVRPFEGLRVLDLGVIVMGAEAGRLFADQGADVIKVENRSFPDGSRAALSRPMTPRFAAAQRGKRSFGVNLRHEDGRRYLLGLVEGADVLLSNFKPGTMESLGLSADVLQQANPRLVVATSSAMGASGPWSGWGGYGPLVRSVTGLTDLWRYDAQGQEFGDSLTVFPDHVAARVVDTAVVAGLIRRRSSGVGCRVEVAQAEVVLALLADLYVGEALLPGRISPQGNVDPHHAPSGVFRCSGEDEWCVIDVRHDSQWASLVEALGINELDRVGYGEAAARVESRSEIDRLVESWTSLRPSTEVEQHLQSAGVPCGAMRHVKDFSADPQLTARRVFTTVVHPLLSRAVTMENGPCSSEVMADPVCGPAPLQGEHTGDIARDLLGLDDEELAEGVAIGVLQPAAP